MDLACPQETLVLDLVGPQETMVLDLVGPQVMDLVGFLQMDLGPLVPDLVGLVDLVGQLNYIYKKETLMPERLGCKF